MKVSPARAREHLQSARLERASALLAAHSGLLGLWDVITLSEHSLPIGKIELRQLIRTAGNHSPAYTLSVLRRTLSTLGLRGTDPRSLNIDWLTDPRAAVRRQMAMADALNTASTPWRGYPYAPAPYDQESVAAVWQA